MTGVPLAAAAPSSRARRSNRVTGAKVRAPDLAAPSSRIHANLRLDGAMNRGNLPSPCPSPHGRGDAVACSVRGFRSCTVGATSLLHPHPLADADTLRCKLAKASLRGEGQDEGRFAQFDTPSGLRLAPMRLRGNDARARTLAPVRNLKLSHRCCFWTPAAAVPPHDDGSARIQVDSI